MLYLLPDKTFILFRCMRYLYVCIFGSRCLQESMAQASSMILQLGCGRLDCGIGWLGHSKHLRAGWHGRNNSSFSFMEASTSSCTLQALLNLWAVKNLLHFQLGKVQSMWKLLRDLERCWVSKPVLSTWCHFKLPSCIVHGTDILIKEIFSTLTYS